MQGDWPLELRPGVKVRVAVGAYLSTTPSEEVSDSARNGATTVKDAWYVSDIDAEADTDRCSSLCG